MTNPLMYSEDYFVILEPNQPEQILTVAELVERLKTIVTTQSSQLPQDVQQIAHPDQQVAYLMKTTCELDLGPGQFFQWYAVRIEK